VREVTTTKEPPLEIEVAVEAERPPGATFAVETASMTVTSPEALASAAERGRSFELAKAFQWAASCA
jgi:hypothetical protein